MIQSKEETTEIKTCREKFKTNLFDAYVLFHDHLTISNAFGVFLMVFSFLNLFCFILHEEAGGISFAENDIVYIRIFQRIFTFSFHIEKSQVITNLANYIIFSVCTFFLLIFLSLVIFAGLEKAEDYKHKASFIFSYFSCLMYWIFVCPITKICLTVIFKQSENSLENVILSGLNLILMLFFAILHSLFGNKSFSSTLIRMHLQE